MLRVTVLLLLLMVTPLLARAHAILVDSTPAANATVGPGHEAITLRFNSRIDRERSRLTLIAPDHSQTSIAVGEDGPPDVMMSAAELQGGAYTLRWQVLAVDGHITRGDVPFNVAP